MSTDGSLLELPRDEPLRSQQEQVTTLLDAARDLASRLELRPVLELLLDHLKALVGYVGTAMLVLEDDDLVFLGLRNPESFTWDSARQIRYPVAGLRQVWPRLCAGEPIIIPDVHADGVEAGIFRVMVGEENLRTTLAFIRTCMCGARSAEQHPQACPRGPRGRPPGDRRGSHVARGHG